VPNEPLIIEKGQKIIIPTFSLHFDPRYFSDPEVFNPERFSTKKKAMIPNGVYLPFGDGPRICIGMYIQYFIKGKGVINEHTANIGNTVIYGVLGVFTYKL